MIETETQSVDSMDNRPQIEGEELTQVRSEPAIETETLSDSTDHPPQPAGGESTQVCSEPVIETETASADNMDHPLLPAGGEMTQVCSEPVIETETLSVAPESGPRRRGLIILGAVLIVSVILFIALGTGLGIVYGVRAITTLKNVIDVFDNIIFLLSRN